MQWRNPFPCIPVFQIGSGSLIGKECIKVTYWRFSLFLEWLHLFTGHSIWRLHLFRGEILEEGRKKRCVIEIFSLVTQILGPHTIFISPLIAPALWTPVFLGSMPILYIFHCLLGPWLSLYFVQCSSQQYSFKNLIEIVTTQVILDFAEFTFWWSRSPCWCQSL